MYINIVNDKCPISFVKTKLALDKLGKGETLIVHLKEGEALENMPASLKELGYEIVFKERLPDLNFCIKIKKKI